MRPGNQSTQSTPEQQTEFAALMRSLGVERPLRDHQNHHCWNRDAHTNGDRHPSLSVRYDRCVFFCHGCGVSGGLRELRQHAGVERGIEGGYRRSWQREHDLLMEVSDWTPDALDSLVDPDKLAAAQAQRLWVQAASRHRGVRNLCRALAQRVRETEHNVSVALSQQQALALGITRDQWTTLLPMLTFVTVERGESARGGSFVGTGKNGALKRTLISIDATSAYSRWCPREVADPLSSVTTEAVSRSRRRPSDQGECLAAQARLARLTTHDEDGPCLGGRPALAEMVEHLATREIRVPQTGRMEVWMPWSNAQRADLRAKFGRNAARTIRSGIELGLLSEVRAGHGQGIVSLTDLGAEVWGRDSWRGRERLEQRYEERQTVWKATCETARVHSIARARSWGVNGEDAPWLPHTPGMVVHCRTGEIVALADLQAAA